MSAKRTAITTIKGGVGKTAITLHLAGMLTLHRKKAVVIDLDLQGTASDAHRYAEKPLFPVISAEPSDLIALEKEYQGYDYIFYDMPRISVGVDVAYMALIKSLDGIVIPFKGSLIEYFAASDFFKIMQAVGIKKIAGVQSMHDRTNDFKKTAYALEDEGMYIFPAVVPYLRSMSEGMVDEALITKEWKERFAPFYKNWTKWINSNE